VVRLSLSDLFKALPCSTCQQIAKTFDGGYLPHAHERGEQPVSYGAKRRVMTCTHSCHAREFVSIFVLFCLMETYSRSVQNLVPSLLEVAISFVLGEVEVIAIIKSVALLHFNRVELFLLCQLVVTKIDRH